MSGPMFFLSSLFCLSLCSFSLQSEGFLQAQGQQIVDAKGDPVLLRGIGLGGWMLQEGYMLELPKLGQQHRIRQAFVDLIGEEKTTEFYQAWLANHTTKADIDAMAALGYNSVRLPMHFNLYTLPVEQEPVAGQNTWLEPGFALTDQLLTWAKANKMYVILDLHAAPGGQGNDLAISDRDPTKASLWDSVANQQKTIALWKKLAERYKDEPWIGGYDLINEPNWGFSDSKDNNGCQEQQNKPLRQLLVQITNAIREVDQKHMIIIEGNCWGNNYKGVLPQWDHNMVLSFHKYWSENSPQSIAEPLALSNKYQMPLWLGESGENSNQWFRDAIAMVEQQGIGWAFWPLKKIRLNNPQQINANADYLKLVAYLQGNAEKPTPEQAYKALMRLATVDIHYNNTIKHDDVAEAMLRQPHSNATRAYRSLRLAPQQALTVQAVDYDVGPLHHAYFDTESANYHVSTGKERRQWNEGMLYRNDGVDITKDTKDRLYISHIDKTEWWQYSLRVAQSGVYRLSVQYATLQDGAKLSVTVNQQHQGSVDLPITKTDTSWQSANLGQVYLQQGNNQLKFQAEQGGFHWQSFTLQPAAQK
ncbi:cellulase family glycosylhydrolase [Rheinheimera sp.]|uniref:cellulase family glycosylhydrolase n=1 Tax=Rheinheimera sp. TaxID=1869214 RepID=UPI00262C8DCB|nr:cellulase family glycosylhydrolase [Rheinheimera sp.]MCA1931138.1 cellulase family glycosylhydrolase [Rheinheimera sp.]